MKNERSTVLFEKKIYFTIRLCYLGVTFLKELIAPIVKHKSLTFKKFFIKNRQKYYFTIGAFILYFFHTNGCNFPVKSYVCNRNVYLLRFPFIAKSKANSKEEY